MTQVSPVVPKDDVKYMLTDAIASQGLNGVINPSQEEAMHVVKIIQSKGLDKIENVTYPLVAQIARKELGTLNSKLSAFTSKMTETKQPGLFMVIDTLNRTVDDVNLEELWQRASTVKPSLMARIKSFFIPSAANESLNSRYMSLYKEFSQRGKGLEAELQKIQKDLLDQKRIQEDNIKMLEESFQTYYNAFQDIRKEFLLLVALEETYGQNLAKFREDNEHQLNEVTISRQLQEYETIYHDIKDRKLLIHTMLIRFPITVQQNQNLIEVSKNFNKEIDNTLDVSFPVIRQSLIGLATSLNSQQAMATTNSTKELERKLSNLSNKVQGDLVVKSITYSSSKRLSEAENIKQIVQQLGEFSNQMAAAKEQSKIEMENASNILNEASQELTRLLENSSISQAEDPRFKEDLRKEDPTVVSEQ